MHFFYKPPIHNAQIADEVEPKIQRLKQVGFKEQRVDSMRLVCSIRDVALADSPEVLETS